jgi:hypothetical protein
MSKKNLIKAIAINALIISSSCSFLEEKRSSVDTSTNTEATCNFETDSTTGLGKSQVGCYPNFEDGYDNSNAVVRYQFKISSDDFVQVCKVSDFISPEWSSSMSNISSGRIYFYASNEDPSTHLGAQVNTGFSLSINGTGGETSFDILGTTTCSWVTGGTLVAELDMEDLKDYKYILMVDQCNIIAGFGMSPYEKSRQLGE